MPRLTTDDDKTIEEDDKNSHDVNVPFYAACWGGFWKRKFKESQIDAVKWRNKYEEKCKQEKQTQNYLTQVGQRGLPVYPNDASPRGLCVIVNNNEFDDGGIRYGSELDQTKLADLFKELDFRVQLYKNLQRDEISNLFRRIASMDHTAYDMFVSVIMTHGTNDQLFGTDGRSLTIENLTTEFLPKRCPTLSTKPKVFIIQSCRGGEVQGTAEHGLRDGFFYDSALVRSTIPSESDFLLAFCTTPGYVAYRDEAEGSYFIQTFVNVVKELHSSTHLLDMLTEVNQRVAEVEIDQAAGKKAKQMPAPVHTLRKQVYI